MGAGCRTEKGKGTGGMSRGEAVKLVLAEEKRLSIPEPVPAVSNLPFAWPGSAAQEANRVCGRPCKGRSQHHAEDRVHQPAGTAHPGDGQHHRTIDHEFRPIPESAELRCQGCDRPILVPLHPPRAAVIAEEGRHDQPDRDYRQNRCPNHSPVCITREFSRVGVRHAAKRSASTGSDRRHARLFS